MKEKYIPSPYPYNLLEDIFGRPLDADLEILDPDRRKGLVYALSTLSEREQRYVKLYYREGLTYEQVAATDQLTRERARQVITKALRKMKHPSRYKYITLGYVIASGELYRQVEKRYAEEVARLESEFKARVNELQEKISRVPRIDANDYAEAEQALRSLEAPIEECDFSVRTYNCLARAKINTFAKLCDCTYEDLRSVRNLGKKSLQEVIDKLDSLGYKLKGGDAK